MRKWVTDQLTAHGPKPVVLIDPDSVVAAGELEHVLGEINVHPVSDWFALRRTWELHGRHHHASGPRLVIVTHDLSLGNRCDRLIRMRSGEAQAEARKARA